jgi:enterochelin esterase-like enzyme
MPTSRWRVIAIVAAVSACGPDDAAPQPPTPRAEPAATPQDAREPAADATDVAERWIEIGRFAGEGLLERGVSAYLPVAYTSEPAARFPVLYLLDGIGAFRLFELGPAIDELTASGAIPPWIVVTVDSTLQRDDELSRDADRFAAMIADSIVPAVDAALRTRTDAASTAIAGYSYGGLTSVRAQVARPERFGRVIAMSPSLWFGAHATIADFMRARGPLPARLWIDIGSREGRRGETVPYMVADARALRDRALARGMRFGATLGYHEAIGESHDMRAAARRIRPALAFALSDRDVSRATAASLAAFRYPVRRGARSGPFAIEARYATGERLTWPAALARVREPGGASYVRELVRPDLTLSIEVAGRRAMLEP